MSFHEEMTALLGAVEVAKTPEELYTHLRCNRSVAAVAEQLSTADIVKTIEDALQSEDPIASVAACVYTVALSYKPRLATSAYLQSLITRPQLPDMFRGLAKQVVDHPEPGGGHDYVPDMPETLCHNDMSWNKLRDMIESYYGIQHGERVARVEVNAAGLRILYGCYLGKGPKKEGEGDEHGRDRDDGE